ncbi:TetR family transcriptional regulator [Rhodococcus pyridinivorans KG-16]|uniref:TetR family transcriptional regulator n=1 Tax=Rhodococcus pyridinivorans KG-16 TaxID=1441730 RepID=A0A0V9UD03_9NOCA|nr:TetR family transcriptional regulator [Rhodococcus pyridinivorans KG-16]
MESTESEDKAVIRAPGRPRRRIDMDAVADAVASLYADGGYDAVTIEATAERLSVSRATLYRTVPTKEKLLGIVFERSTQDLYASAIDLVSEAPSSADALFGLMRLHIRAAVDMRHHLSVFFGGAGLPPDVYARWQTWTREYEHLWVDVVNDAMHDGVLDRADPRLTTRLLLGMVIWVSRWYRPEEGLTPDEIADTAVALIARRLQ